MDSTIGAVPVVPVEVEQALGPGVDFELEGGRPLGRRIRPSRIWLGFDRAALSDSDDGLGRRVPVLVGLPASTFAGARLEVELTGGWLTGTGPVLVAALPGASRPDPVLARIAAAVGAPAAWLDAGAAAREAQRARQRHRERRSHARIVGGRAWSATGVLSPEIARFVTPHSAAEYRLARLPPRYLRGLDGLLDDGERMLYWIERPALIDAGLISRIRGGLDRRAAVLALTDRQLLWVVDHVQPDRYLSDWGVDVEVVPIERITEVSSAALPGKIAFAVATGGEARTYELPIELEAEVRVMHDLVARFAQAPDGRTLRRRYALEPIAFDVDTAARFGQEAEAAALLAAASEQGEPLAFLFSPRRPGQRHPAAIALRAGEVLLAQRGNVRAVDLASVSSLRLTLSPLVGHLSAGSAVALAYPAPLMDRGAAFARLARRALANLAG